MTSTYGVLTSQSNVNCVYSQIFTRCPLDGARGIRESGVDLYADSTDEPAIRLTSSICSSDFQVIPDKGAPCADCKLTVAFRLCWAAFSQCQRLPNYRHDRTTVGANHARLRWACRKPIPAFGRPGCGSRQAPQIAIATPVELTQLRAGTMNCRPQILAAANCQFLLR